MISACFVQVDSRKKPAQLRETEALYPVFKHFMFNFPVLQHYLVHRLFLHKELGFIRGLGRLSYGCVRSAVAVLGP